ncbi:hypothetical protein CR513_41320, partial [Mucuna pruriens]
MKRMFVYSSIALYLKDPFLALSLALCLLSLGGLPPLTGFFQKTSFILVRMAYRLIFLGCNRTPY